MTVITTKFFNLLSYHLFMETYPIVSLDSDEYEDLVTQKVAQSIIVPSPEGFVSLPIIIMDGTPWIYLGREAVFDLYNGYVEIQSNGYKIIIEQFIRKARITASSPKTRIIYETEKFYPYFRSDRTGVYLTFVKK